MRNATHTPTIPGPVEIHAGTLYMVYQYRSNVIDHDGSYFDFFFTYVYNTRRGRWEIDIIQLPSYRGRSKALSIVHMIESDRGGYMICVAEDHKLTSLDAAKKLSMGWGDLQAEYIKTGVTPDQQILRNHGQR